MSSLDLSTSRSITKTMTPRHSHDKMRTIEKDSRDAVASTNQRRSTAGAKKNSTVDSYSHLCNNTSRSTMRLASEDVSDTYHVQKNGEVPERSELFLSCRCNQPLGKNKLQTLSQQGHRWTTSFLLSFLVLATSDHFVLTQSSSWKSCCFTQSKRTSAAFAIREPYFSSHFCRTRNNFDNRSTQLVSHIKPQKLHSLKPLLASTASEALSEGVSLLKSQQQGQQETPNKQKDMVKSSAKPPIPLSFSHVHFYVDKLETIHHYKELEQELNELARQLTLEKNQHGLKGENSPLDLKSARRTWNNLVKNHKVAKRKEGGEEEEKKTDGPQETPNEKPTFVGQNRDLVRQLIAGMGFRVTAARMPNVPTEYLEEQDDTHKARKTLYEERTRSVLVTSPDGNGVQFVVTCIDGQGQTNDVAPRETQPESHQESHFFHHFDAGAVQSYLQNHGGRQGVAVLAFEVPQKENESTSSPLQNIYNRYVSIHPALLPRRNDHCTGQEVEAMNCLDDKDIVGIRHYPEADILEVYAYYQEQDEENHQDGSLRNKEHSRKIKQPDRGTILRFIQRKHTDNTRNHNNKANLPLPGLTPLKTNFDGTSQAAYCDHWVSNVFSRTEFLQTLEDTLGFTQKVNFNAGVVAAGESQIESTVTGNTPAIEQTITNRNVAKMEVQALRDQRQVYLPINNAMSPVGHVHGFLQELGQGVQHIASRVEDLPAFVQRANDYRRVTEEGFTFLNIPRSYYGVLTVEQLVRGCDLPVECARAIVDLCEEVEIVAADGAVDLELSRGEVEARLFEGENGNIKNLLEVKYRDECITKKNQVISAILKSRYINMYNLLQDRLSEATYMQVVKNQILVDVQAGDVLLQIFTSNILQRQVGDEAPFLEFIQRVCGSEKANSDMAESSIKPGCGGFGIRNFLTLFLSIEVSKAMMNARRAQDEGDVEAEAYFREMVQLFTEQLNESNPILTEISNAMTEEGEASSELKALMTETHSSVDGEQVGVGKADKESVQQLTERIRLAMQKKNKGNQELMACSEKYKLKMRDLRETRVRGNWSVSQAKE